jgi:hypothetical protein
MAGMAETGVSPVARAERFVWLTARVLEQRRFAMHFPHGNGDGDGVRGADAVEAALSAYRNDDGGYGHALEPDLRGPSSEPLHVAYALRVLAETGRCGGRQADSVCRYLTTVSTPQGALSAARPAQHTHPTAPWIPVTRTGPADLLATGPVVGTLHRSDVWHPWLFRATDFCWEAVERLNATHPYEVRAAVAFLDGAPDRRRAQAAAERLGRLVREQRLVTLDPERASPYPVGGGRAPGEPHFAYDYAASPGSLARRWFSDAEIDRSLDFLSAAQEADGGWPVRRRAWAPGSRLERRPIATIDALLTLRAYGRRIN